MYTPGVSRPLYFSSRHTCRQRATRHLPYTTPIFHPQNYLEPYNFERYKEWCTFAALNRNDMKRIVCPKCEHKFTFDETRYKGAKNISFACPECRKHFSLSIDEINEMNEEEHSFPYGYITVVENSFCYRQTFGLKPGDNIIGRRSPGSEADIAIESGDMSMDRRHCIINVKVQGNTLTHTLRDNPSLTGTFLRQEILGDRDRARLRDGDIVTIGATTLIIHLPEEDDEYFG